MLDVDISVRYKALYIQCLDSAVLFYILWRELVYSLTLP